MRAILLSIPARSKNNLISTSYVSKCKIKTLRTFSPFGGRSGPALGSSKRDKWPTQLFADQRNVICIRTSSYLLLFLEHHESVDAVAIIIWPYDTKPSPAGCSPLRWCYSTLKYSGCTSKSCHLGVFSDVLSLATGLLSTKSSPDRTPAYTPV